ncbi:MAG: NUDIX hydrolase [Muribaculaceae bacterium]|nr:NUDIX hydrolase [Muribaculaceae bacterium]
MEKIHYRDIPRFHVAVDCMIFSVISGRLHILLVERDFEPEKGKWSLIGGFVTEGESVDNAAKRVLYQLTGIHNAYIRQIGTFGEVERDPGARVISVAYFALLNIENIEIKNTPGRVKWVDIDELPPLSFDHPEMIRKALEVMREKILTESLAFNLLPELFTLTQLQSLVESLMGRKLDKRNFRKRVMELPGLFPTDLIDKENSKRGAKLYRFEFKPLKYLS